ncbi:hypothetical protein VNI00_017478 [Paramarasmius palmivorus]|uniref:Uncharacterized protein n=1 Tax=Paramarasmius palmivorus TaxID=297713 RepID=A0AAW0B8F8_9AGAR
MLALQTGQHFNSQLTFPNLTWLWLNADQACIVLSTSLLPSLEFIGIDWTEREWEHRFEVFTKLRNAANGQDALQVRISGLNSNMRWEAVSSELLQLLPANTKELFVDDYEEFTPSDTDLLHANLGIISSALAELPRLERFEWEAGDIGFKFHQWSALECYQSVSQIGSQCPKLRSCLLPSHDRRTWIRIVDNVWAPSQNLDDGQWMVNTVQDRTYPALQRLVQHFEELTKWHPDSSLSQAVQRYKMSPEEPCAFEVAQDFLMIGDVLRIWDWAGLVEDENERFNRFIDELSD